MLSRIFIVALAIRWAYAFAMFALMGDAGLQTVDSETYLFDAHAFATHLTSGSVSGLEWLGPLANAMPLSQWLFTLCVLAFGASAPLAYVLLQGAIDSATCLLIAGIARTLNPSYAAPAGIAAAFNPTQIVMAGLFLTDTPFLFFCTLILFAAMRWLNAPSWRWAILIGAALGLATLDRALVIPFAAVLLTFLLMVQIARRRPLGQAFAQLVGAGAILMLCVVPLLWRNVSQYGSWSLTPQTGIHFALWIVPWVKNAADGTPWQSGYDQMQHRVDELYPTPTSDPFEQSRRYQKVARAELAVLGIRPMVKAWLVGAAINIGSPASTHSPLIMQLPHTGFYGTPGTSTLDKINNFLFHSDNATYAWILLIGIAGVAVVRCIQVVGAMSLLREGGHLPALILFGLWIGFVLAVNGPVASPKYRLPIEGPLMVLTGAGLAALLRRKAARAA